ncbi:hypothetical protein LTR86_009284 [Recurvomyces mirabilis]|nr:hypothetical protein LTR86_009284 [Recurvomyces mirabilis]
MPPYRLSLAALAAAATLVVAGPCDIYASGGTPCVAAHGTTRALYSGYNGALYQSGRGNHLTPAPKGSAGAGPGPNGSDNPASATGAPVHLNGQKAYGRATDVLSVQRRLTHLAGVYIASGNGYRIDKTNGVATGDAAEGIYAIFDGTHYNGGKDRSLDVEA